MTAVYFRKLDNKRNWDPPPWSGRGFSADVVRCLQTRSNSLSVFGLNDCDDQLARVVAALALTRDYLGHVDLAVIPATVLADCRLTCDRTDGGTPDTLVNSWHLDIVNLSLYKLRKLAGSIRRCGKIRRFQQRKVIEAIRTTMGSGNVDPEKVNARLAKSLVSRGIYLADLT